MSWAEDVVADQDAALRRWDGERLPIDVPAGQYRVRYSAAGMDRGQEQDTLVAGDPLDRYLLQFWPAPPADDRIVRSRSEAARYWHDARTGDPEADDATQRAVGGAARLHASGAG